MDNNQHFLKKREKGGVTNWLNRNKEVKKVIGVYVNLHNLGGSGACISKRGKCFLRGQP